MIDLTDDELFEIWFDCLCHRLASVIFSVVKDKNTGSAEPGSGKNQP